MASAQPVGVPIKAGPLGFAWGVGDEICLFSTQQPQEGSQSTGSSEVVTTRWSQVKGSLRKLVNEGHGVYSLLHRQVVENTQGGQVPSDILVQSSRYYRALVGDHLDSLGKEGGTSSEVELEKRRFQVCDLLWSLYETFFLSRNVTVARALADWVQRHFAAASAEQLDAILATPQPETMDIYWDAVYSTVLGGSTDKAATLLERHSARPTGQSKEFASDILSIVATLLNAMPPRPKASTNLPEYTENFTAWQTRCQEVLTKRKDVVKWPQLQVVLGILSGDSETIASHTRTWQEQLVAEILYNHPTMKLYDVADIARKIRPNKPGISPELDDNMMAIFELDAYRAINISMTEMALPWALAHLTDLMELAGHLQSYDLGQDGLSLRNYFILEFVDSLISTSSLWQVALVYLTACGDRGKALMAEIVERQPVENEKKAFKLIAVCEKYGLVEQARRICLTIGVTMFHRHRHGSCCYWLLRSHDSARLATISSNIIQDYVRHGSLSDLDAVADVLSTSQSTALAEVGFLTRFRDLQAALHDGRLADAAQLVLKLLGPGGAPERFWFDLLFLAVPLLEDPDIRFNSQNTYVLMDKLQATLSSHRAHENLEHVAQSQVDTVRLALARNLSRALISAQ